MADKNDSKQEWRERLTDEQFQICRKKGTERPFSGHYVDCKKAGVYHCICCGSALFDAETKFDSGTGWPSFWDKVSAESINQMTDKSHGVRRIEVTCRSCDSHLGHVFEDGPQPTGLRYCINSTSLDLKEKS